MAEWRGMVRGLLLLLPLFFRWCVVGDVLILPALDTATTNYFGYQHRRRRRRRRRFTNAIK